MQNPQSTPSTPQELQQAFALFNEVSEQLTNAYADLQVKAESLTQELAVANGELRRQFEEKEALSQRLSQLLEALPGGVVVLDAEGLVEEVNPVATRLLGLPLVGQTWLGVQNRALKPTLNLGEWELAGDERRVSISRSSREGTGGVILLLQDITEAHAMEAQLQRHKRLSAMGEMAAALAHQLRTPLATALLYTSNLRDTNLAEEERVRFTDKALGRLRHLEALIKDMLVFVKGGRNAQENILVSNLVAEVQQVMEPQMAEREVKFVVHDKSVGLSLLGSREALAGALTNLLANAMQASESGSKVVLTVAPEALNQMLFKVADNGRGIGPDILERLFEPFFTTRTEGTGLGLAIVREVAQIHGGDVTVQSKLGTGSTFSLRLPSKLIL
ncbi:MAG: sensor histidine kinase [Methylophilaceae bacterium]